MTETPEAGPPIDTPPWSDPAPPGAAAGSAAGSALPDDGPALFPADALPAPPAAAAPYRVLARKYRPQRFEDLIGQEPMVRTLTNAFAAGRIPQAWMLTGVRGVGKTTTARILARALNFRSPAVDRPSIDLTVPGEHCKAIMEGRHVDVIEMDAASNTGIADVREIIEASRYRPATARYKVYIIDEVHMLSTAAFNGLLKTLEEPPEHVKFVFATTEIRKVPVTVLSRCQRFDLRRVEADVLVAHLAKIAGAESVTVEDEALALVARAAEGSVRDSLSLLDQAIAHGAGAVTAEAVRAMLGLADRARVVDLFEHVMRGDAGAALAELSDQYASGAEPSVVLTDLAAFTHLVTRLRIVPEAARDPSLTAAERDRGTALAARLTVPVLTRAWQILLKAIPEVQGSPRPLAAAEMALVRLAYAADLPSPEEAIRMIAEGKAGGAPSSRPSGPSGGGGGGATAVAASAGAAFAGGAPVPRGAPRLAAETAPSAVAPAATPRPAILPASGPVLASLADVAALCGERRELRLKFAVERQLKPVRFEPGRIEVEPTADAPSDLAGEIGRKLTEWTGTRWVVTVTRGAGGTTLHDERLATESRRRDDAAADPLVSAVLARFPGAKIVDIRVRADEAPLLPAAALLDEDGEIAPTEEPLDDGLDF
jgi:DNA polymerase-3 subunit gamma/tau